MMGMVFEEFFTYVEREYSEDMVDDIIVDAKLENDGAYTAVGRYDFNDLVALVSALSNKVSVPIEDLVHGFGFFVFGKLYDSHQQYLPDWKTPFDVFRKIDNHIHIEVKKLYPNAELPRFYVEKDETDEMVLKYSSVRPLAKFAEGIIKGCVSYFDETMSVDHITLEQDGDHHQARFIIKKEK